MVHRILASLLAATCFLVAGCASLRTANREASEERAAERRAQAHAHYMAGAMSDSPEEALKEYYQAVLLDPSDESLILEVARQFAENKQTDKALDVLSHAASQPDASGAIYTRLGMLYS